ncbi:GIY-YIG nuclease family protein [Bacillus atrophaeus]|uniref:GIY-YIG nuclease family protein n=1 Tax=Bacillus atrophaeus TaxID=1452 RepID=UPI00227DA2EA|nr:GIY-YIG nuclease family protein [Bacillus atrophaeus]MCY8922076.1 GIY-YIG nuclease family protein [Bacillus atrophaeus]
MKGIYQITNKHNMKKYIGSSINVFKRWKQHVTDLHYGLHHSHLLQKDWDKYSLNDFTFEILEYVEDKKDLLKIEQMWLDGEDTNSLYNVLSSTTMHNISAPSNFVEDVFYCKNLSEETQQLLRKNLIIHKKKGKLLYCGNYKYDYSKTWFSKNSKDVQQLKLNMNNYFYNQTSSTSKDRCWTTFTQYSRQLEFKGNKKRFVPLNGQVLKEKKSYLCFAANCFPNSLLTAKYNELSSLDEDTYALSLILKWIVNCGNINKPLTIFIPSLRMEKLLSQWLKND